MSRGTLVLVIDDEPQLCRFLRASLPPHGFRLLEAGTTSEAVAVTRTNTPTVHPVGRGL